MKSITLLLLAVSASAFCQLRSSEFKTYPNGLIYNEHTMARLGKIVDSLNLKFKSCDLSHPYYTIAQGIAHKVSAVGRRAQQDINSGISLADYTRKYNQKAEKTWIIKTNYTSWDDDKYFVYQEINGDDQVELEYKPSNDVTSGWVLSANREIAYYIESLRPHELPFEYARLVQYVDCMIDTTQQIFFSEAHADDRWIRPRVINAKANLFIDYAKRFPGRPHWNSSNNEEYKKSKEAYDKWEGTRLSHLDAEIKKWPILLAWLTEGVAEALQSVNSSGDLEFYADRYLSKETALKLKRSRIVVGRCSQDSRPRDHAQSICILAAETAQWDIFLRSHLDIMNDNFARASDGSYAWQKRQTYLKELEELDINAIDLLIGTALNVDNVSNNHYQASIWRTGKALADADNKPELEERLIKMIDDENLDPLNRIRIAYVLRNYLDHLQTVVNPLAALRKIHVESRLDAAISNMPTYLQTAWQRD